MQISILRSDWARGRTLEKPATQIATLRGRDRDSSAYGITSTSALVTGALT